MKRSAAPPQTKVVVPLRFRLLILGVTVAFQALFFWQVTASRERSTRMPERFARSAAGLSYLRGIDRDVVDIVEDDLGDVWVATSEEVLRYPAGDPERGERMLGRALLAEGERAHWQSPASLSAGRDGVVFVGGFRGDLRAVRRDGTVELAPSKTLFRTRIYRVAAVGEDLWVATNQGLYVGRPGAREFAWAWRTDSAFELLERPEGPPLVGISSGVVGGPPESLRPLWRTREARRRVRTIALSDDTLWVGTMSGLLGFDAAALLAGRLEHASPRGELEGREVTALATAADGGLWVGLPAPAGLQLRLPGGEWRALGRRQGFPDGNVSALAIDRRGTLWVAVYGVGALVGDEASARQRAR